MANISADLKKAIVEMLLKERDKLLLRLIGKDDLLIEQLEFKLLEVGFSTESRRLEVQQKLDKIYTFKLSNPSDLLYYLRENNASITRHLKVTKDKYGEVELTLSLLHDAMDMKPHFFGELKWNNEKISEYIVKKTAILLKKYNALDPELKLDFLTKINVFLELLHNRSTQYYAILNTIPNKYEIEY